MEASRQSSVFARQANGGYRFRFVGGGGWAKCRRTGTIAPLEGSAAALAAIALPLDVLDEILNLKLHLLHALAHLQNNGDAADVYGQVAG